MPRSASVLRRTLRFAALPAALLSLTACGALETAPAAPANPTVLKGKGGARGKPVNVLKDGGFEPGANAWTADPASLLCAASEQAHPGFSQHCE